MLSEKSKIRLITTAVGIKAIMNFTFLKHKTLRRLNSLAYITSLLCLVVVNTLAHLSASDQMPQHFLNLTCCNKKRMGHLKIGK